jgi:cation:H+ antiporter
MPEFIIFIISIAAVIIGADWLGNAATHIATRLALPRVIIGATIISLATTLPEIVIATISGAEGSPEVGLGTVFGSPFANIGLIFGILLIFSKPEINKAYYSRTVQFFLVAIALVFVALLGGSVSPAFSVALVFFGVSYLIIQSIIGKQEESILEKIEHRFERFKNFFSEEGSFQQIFYLVVGVVLLMLGAHFLIGSAVTLAGILNIPQIIIGVVVIALGTSFPEAFTTINSILKNRVGLSAGNLFGASVLDLTLALGLGSIFNGAKIEPAALYLTVGGLVLLALISLVYVFEKVSPKILGVSLIAVYLIFLVWFSNLDSGIAALL